MSGDRTEAEVAVAVAGDLVDEVDLPGEVLAHKALTVCRPLARRQRDVVELARERAHGPAP